jgi:hypothetical protein
MTRYEGIETSVITRLMQKPSAQHDRFSYVFCRTHRPGGRLHGSLVLPVRLIAIFLG